MKRTEPSPNTSRAGNHLLMNESLVILGLQSTKHDHAIKVRIGLLRDKNTEREGRGYECFVLTSTMTYDAPQSSTNAKC